LAGYELSTGRRDWSPLQSEEWLEPNLHFTPDMKWIIFRSNLHGAIHVYAVEIARHSKS
jgi:hypothetical protein